MPRRKLIKGDRVRITGPWHPSGGGEHHIGENATIINPNRGEPWTSMKVDVVIDGLNYPLHWCRENLRALSRRKNK